MTLSQHKKTTTLTIFAMIGAILAVCYYPGLAGPFMLDDSPNILDNQRILITELSAEQFYLAATTSLDGYAFSRGLAFISFGLNYYFSGFNLSHFDFKLTNLAIHLLNAILVYQILVIIFSVTLQNSRLNQRLLAIVVCLAWACHPIQVSTVLYAVQRMTLLATTSTLVGCYYFLTCRVSKSYSTAGLVGPLKLLLVLMSCIAIGFHFKESAVLLPIYVLAIECLLRPFLRPNHSLDRLILAFGIAIATLSIIYLAYHLGNIRENYLHRNFTLEERLLTEPRVLFWYLKIILLPQLSNFSLFLDDYPISTALTSPLTTLFSIIGWLALALASLITKYRYITLACLIWFLGGHVMESSFIPLEIAFEHRNYLPSLAPLAMVLTVLASILQAKVTRPVLTWAPLLTALFLLCFLCTIRATYWGNRVMFITQSIEARPFSTRARSTAGLYYLTRDPVQALEHYRISGQKNPSVISPLTSQFAVLSTVYGLYDHPVSETSEDLLIAGVRALWSKQELKLQITILDDEIADRLSVFAISAQVMSILDKFTLCAIGGGLSCADIRTIERWVDIALKNPKKPDLYISFLQFHKSRLLAAGGHPDQALLLMRQITIEHPENYFYKTRLGQLYSQLGMEKEADETLSKVPKHELKLHMPKQSPLLIRYLQTESEEKNHSHF
ncbi:MAG: hypothetical protein KUG81_07070 [Gammaproteobacteria bacterium]|nr:hypothetical protein [Gammaproteobacteria bacterium]